MKNDLPKRKSTRLKYYDYSMPGMYFLTVCVKDKEQLLGKIVNCEDTLCMILSDYGLVLDKCINFMNKKYQHIKVDKYIIMPNHFHMILNISEHINQGGASETAAPYNNEISKFVSLLKRYCNREYGLNIWQTSFNDHIIRGQKDYLKIWEYIDTKVARWKQDTFYEK